MNSLLVVTGGTKGIGRSISDQFASAGFDIITCARNEDQLEQLKQEISGINHKVNLHGFKADLSNRAETDSFIDFIKENGVVPDVLINNTGVFYPGSVHDEEEGVLEKSMETNLYSAYRITRGVLPGMIERKAGHIFNICSVASIEPYTRGASYCMSKFALLGMTKVLREELKPYGIRVTAVIPGSTLTTSWEGVEIPEEDFMMPEDIASAIYNTYSLSPRTVVEELVLRPQKGDV